MHLTSLRRAVGAICFIFERAGSSAESSKLLYVRKRLMYGSGKSFKLLHGTQTGGNDEGNTSDNHSHSLTYIFFEEKSGISGQL